MFPALCVLAIVLFAALFFGDAAAEGDKATPDPGPGEGDPGAGPVSSSDVLSGLEEKVDPVGVPGDTGKEDPGKGGDSEAGKEGRESGDAGLSTVLGMLKEAGIQHDYGDENAAVQGLIEAKRKIGERDAYSSLGQRVLPLLPEFQTFLAGRDKAPADDPRKQVWDPPPFEPNWLRELDKDEEQRDPAVMGKLAAYEGYKAEKWDGWTRDPFSFVEEVVLPMVQPQIRAALSQVDTRNTTRSLIEENRDVLSQNYPAAMDMVRKGVPLAFAVERLKTQAELAKFKSGKEKEKDDGTADPVVDDKRTKKVHRSSDAVSGSTGDPQALAMATAAEMGVAVEGALPVD